MESLVQYASSDEEEQPQAQRTTVGNGDTQKGASSTSLVALPVVNSAPAVLSSSSSSQVPYLTGSQKQLTVNLPVDATLAPYHGPDNMYARYGRSDASLIGSGKEIVTGVVEPTNMEDFNFDAQYHTYNQKHTGIQRNRQAANGNAGDIVSIHDENVFTAKKATNKKPKVTKTFEQEFGSTQEHGVWAPCKDVTHVPTDLEQGTMTEEQKKIREERIAAKKRKAEAQEAKTYDEEVDFDRMIEKKTGHLLPARLQPGQKAMEAKTQFLDPANEYDYQGRPWIEPPRSIKPDDGDHQVFLPKRCVHKWAGHTKGVQAIELFPRYGHLLLSGSMDNTVRIWDVHTDEKKCKRIYEGHSNAVRDINFSNDGRQFLSCGFDRFIQLWDTETGQSIQSFTNRRVPYCIKFYPEDNTNFVIGDSNHMVVQFDTRSGEIVQEYNHHLQAVNSVTFVDDNRRFVSTSDDKKILIWEWGIPVPIKYISEPSMQAMPTVALHPSGGFFAGQSLNNKIEVYTARDKFKLCRKKVFRGHTNAGYACQVSFSPNGQYLFSGDGEGNACFWDWKSTKLYKKFKAHDRGPCIGAVWHPLEPSKVVTCGWDGLIKYWD